MTAADHAVVVVGAGPAGLAVSHELSRRRIDHVVLERGGTLGHTWATLYDSLVLHTGRHLTALPGLPWPSSTPLFPTRQAFLDYLYRYAERFGAPVETNADVVQAEHGPDGVWSVRTPGRTWRARVLVVATGIASNPYAPELPDRAAFGGRVLHSREYRRPGPFAGRRVLVVGAGNSAGEIVAELAAARVAVTVAVRSGAHVVPRQILGVPIQYVAVATSRLPRVVQRAIAIGVGRASALVRGPSVLPKPPRRECTAVPLVGYHMVDAIRSGAARLTPGVERFTADGVRFADGSAAPFDDVILATGYRPAVAFLGGLVTPDACGFARRRNRVASADAPNLYFVGHHYDMRGAILNIGRDARLVVEEIRHWALGTGH